MGRGGFEPPKQIAADLQSVPFGHSGICPFIQHTDVYCKADDRTRTDNLLITNQLLCQLSHIGLMDGGGFEPPKQFAADLQSVPFGHSGIHPLYNISVVSGTYRARTCDPLLVRQMLSQLS